MANPSKTAEARAKHAEYMRQYRTRPEARDKHRAYNLAYQKRPDKIEKVRERKLKSFVKQYRLDPEKYNARGREFYAKNKAEVSAKARARRAIVKDIGKGSALGWAKRLLAHAATSSARRGHGAPTVTAEDLVNLWESQAGLCYWTLIPMNRTPRSPWVVSLERIDNSLGYVTGNVCLCTWFANRAKGQMSAKDFSYALDEIARLRCVKVDW